MSDGDATFRRLQQLARTDGAAAGRPAATSEYLTRHALESFLDRLSRTAHARDFVLKGGILLGVYGVRRATKDIDAEAIDASATPAHLRQVVRDTACGRDRRRPGDGRRLDHRARDPRGPPSTRGRG